MIGGKIMEYNIRSESIRAYTSRWNGAMKINEAIVMTMSRRVEGARAMPQRVKRMQRVQ